MSDELRRTPLFDFHQAHGGRMVPFAGWEMPVQYTSILEEHKAVRESMGLFDVSHMGEVFVLGPDAKRFLDQITTNDLKHLVDGKAIYSLMCFEDGGVIDDVIIYQISDLEFMVCVNASNVEKDFEWMTDQAVGHDCRVVDRSNQYGQIAIQGPQAVKFIADLMDASLEHLNRFHFARISFSNIKCIVSRTGYTGEDGFEIYAPAHQIAELTHIIYNAGKDKGLSLAGLGCRDSLRLEAGYPLYGHEIDSTLDPITAGLSWAVKFNKDDPFNGREVLLKKKKDGPPSRVKFFVLSDRRIAREGDPIVDESGVKRGTVLSGSLSPILQRAIGSALIDSAALDDKRPLFADLRGKRYPLEFKKPPLHQS